VTLIYLKGEVSVLADRLAKRAGHYMPAMMLESQLATLEEPLPDEGLTFGIESGIEELVGAIRDAVPARSGGIRSADAHE
jgi:gluconokinase